VTSPVTSVHVDTARTWRGGQSQVLQLVTGLSSLGHPTWLVAHTRGELLRRASEGLRFVGLSPRSEFDVQAGWQLSRVLQQANPDVVHAHDPMAVALTAMALTMQTGGPKPPLVIASRRVDFHLKSHAFSRWKYRHVDRFIAVSKAIAAILERDGIAADRIDVVHDGVDTSLIDKTEAVDAHAAFWLPHGAPLVGNVAALVGHKGQKHLVAAARLVVREVPDARLLMVGEGELREPLERQIKQLGLERHVRLTGFRADALGIIKSLDLFVMSSITEGLGSVVLEAMACSRAVVATRAGGLPEIVEHGITGLVVDPGDEQGLADAIVSLLRDPARRETIGRAGRARVDREFSLEQMVRETVGVYRRRGQS
jgi:glycosyltransferase involved in cell wall biosynthesis